MADFWGNGAFTLDNETYLTFTVRDKKKSRAAAKTTTLDHTPPRNGGPGSVGPGSAYGGSYRGSPGYYGGHSGYGAYSHQPPYMSPPHMSQPPYGHHPYMPHPHYGQQAPQQGGPEQMAQLTQLLASMGMVPQPQLTPPPHHPHRAAGTAGRNRSTALVPSPRGLSVDTTTRQETSPLASHGSYQTASSTTDQTGNAAKRSRNGDP